MKVLSPRIGEEKSLKVRYAMCRFMESKKAFKIQQDQKGTWLTVKPIHEKNLSPEMQIHFRFTGTDQWFGGTETVDCDLYIDLNEFKKILDLCEEK
jgi:hypothetical protein